MSEQGSGALEPVLVRSKTLLSSHATALPLRAFRPAMFCLFEGVRCEGFLTKTVQEKGCAAVLVKLAADGLPETSMIESVSAIG
jgi:hypothetical protein